VAEDSCGGANIDASNPKRRRGGMPEVVKPRRRYSGFARDAVEGAGRRHWSDAAAKLVGEDRVCEAFAGL
jgi:hypothetical protein